MGLHFSGKGALFGALGMAGVAAAASTTVWHSDAALRASAQTTRRAIDTVTIGAPVPGRTVSDGFLGLSFEYWALENYAGKNPRAVDPVLVQLIRNLVAGQTASIRIGGVTTDRTWWPVAGVTRPPGVNYTLTRRRLEVAKSLAVRTNARLILGVQFEADSLAEASHESRAMVSVIGRNRIEGFELGNEPELYANRWFYKIHGQEFFGRPHNWDFGRFVRDYVHVARAMGRVPVAGPAIGAYSWMQYLQQFLTAQRVALVTLHRYPLQACGVGPGAPNYPTIGHLVGRAASRGLAGQFGPYVNIVHADHLTVRNAEMNSVSCGDAHGVANTFASALWALDALFGMVNIGVDGVNIHTYSGAADQLFSTKQVGRRWQAFVAPEYYGVLLFSQAAPAGSRLLQVSGRTDTSATRVWATRAPDGRIHVVMINDSLRRPETITVRLASGSSTAGTLERLSAPSVGAMSGVTLGRRSFGRSTSTGLLRGAPQLAHVRATNASYRVRMPAVSAALLTIRR